MVFPFPSDDCISRQSGCQPVIGILVEVKSHGIHELDSLVFRLNFFGSELRLRGDVTQRGVEWQMKIDDARTKLASVYPKIKT